MWVNIPYMDPVGYLYHDPPSTVQQRKEYSGDTKRQMIRTTLQACLGTQLLHTFFGWWDPLKRSPRTTTPCAISGVSQGLQRLEPNNAGGWELKRWYRDAFKRNFFFCCLRGLSVFSAEQSTTYFCMPVNGLGSRLGYPQSLTNVHRR